MTIWTGTLLLRIMNFFSFFYPEIRPTWILVGEQCREENNGGVAPLSRRVADMPPCCKTSIRFKLKSWNVKNNKCRVWAQAIGYLGARRACSPCWVRSWQTGGFGYMYTIWHSCGPWVPGEATPLYRMQGCLALKYEIHQWVLVYFISY